MALAGAVELHPDKMLSFSKNNAEITVGQNGDLFARKVVLIFRLKEFNSFNDQLPFRQGSNFSLGRSGVFA